MSAHFVKAISIVAPSGSRIAAGEKRLEIRRWAPDLAPDEDLLIIENGRFLTKDSETDPDGRAVALVRVAAVRPFVEADMDAACATSFEPGWLAWELVDVRPLVVRPKFGAERRIYAVPRSLLLLG